MSKDLEKAFLEQGRRMFELCRLYIDGGLRPEEKDSLTKEIEDAFDKWEVDNRALFEEITANMEEPMSEQQRERYCFSLLTPLGEYSSTLYPKWLIDKTKESIIIEQGRGGDISYLEKQIDNANRRADKYKDLAFSIGKLKRNKVESVFFELAQKVYEYGILLDAAFTMHGLDLKRLQEKCGVWVKHFTIDELRALDISYYIGSEALAEEYLSRLPEEQQGIIESFFCEELRENKKAMTILQRAVDKGLIELNGEHLKFIGSNALLAYMCGIAFCDDTKEYNHYLQGYKVKRGSGFFPDAFLSDLFEIKNLGQSRLQLDSLPRGYEKVDKCTI